MPPLVSKLILGSAILFAGAGVGLIVAGEPVIGAILIAVGLTDVVTVPLLRGRMGTGAKPAESENPYARED